MYNFIALLHENLPSLFQKMLQQTYLTLAAIVIAMCISIPIGIMIARKEHIRNYVLGCNSILQTLPSLAVLGFLLPIVGIGIKAALVALILYAMLPILRNTVTGLLGIPHELLEAADSIGFTPKQKILLVELPLAMPVIIAGIRTATAMGVGIATLAAFIGAGGLGDFIYQGLSLNNGNLILLGAIPAAILALVLDFAIAKLEKIISMRKILKKKYYRVMLIIVALFLFVYGVIYLSFLHKEHENQIRIGTKNFTEQLLLGEIMAQLLQAKSPLHVVRVFNLGGTLICHQALLKGEIDIYPEYTGTSYMLILKQSKLNDPISIYNYVRNSYQAEFNVRWLDNFGFNNNNVVVVREDLARNKHLTTISDLQKIAATLSIGVPPDAMERQDGYAGLRNKYHMKFDRVRLMDPGLMYKAINRKQLDSIMAFSTDGRILAYHLVILKDDLHLFPPYIAAPIIKISCLKKHPEVAGILNMLGGKLTREVMLNLNYQVDELKRSPAVVAREFLVKNKLVK